MPGLITSLLIGVVAGLAVTCLVLFRRAGSAASSRDEAQSRVTTLQVEFEQEGQQQAQRSELELNAANYEAAETAAADTARSELESTKAEQRAGDARAEELARRLAQSEVSPPSAGSIRKLQDALRQSERGRLEAQEEARQAAQPAEVGGGADARCRLSPAG